MLLSTFKNMVDDMGISKIFLLPIKDKMSKVMGKMDYRKLGGGVFLGVKKPILCLLAVFIFAIAEYGTNILQVKSSFSPTLMLSFPYIISLLLYVIYKITSNRSRKNMYI